MPKQFLNTKRNPEPWFLNRAFWFLNLGFEIAGSYGNRSLFAEHMQSKQETRKPGLHNIAKKDYAICDHGVFLWTPALVCAALLTAGALS